MTGKVFVDSNTLINVHNLDMAPTASGRPASPQVVATPIGAHQHASAAGILRKRD